MSIAVSFLALTKRSATFRRNILILVRTSLRTPPVGVPIEGLEALSASSLVMRPPLPVPTTADAGISRSANILRAAGLGTCFAEEAGAIGAVEGAEAVDLGATGASCLTGCDGEVPADEVPADEVPADEVPADEAPAGAFALVSIKHTTCPTFTASPSSACSVITPLASAGSSRVALSESTSATAWSLVT